MVGWLATVDVPLFVSHRRLAKRKTLPRAAADWALDSGGFTELAMHGRWVTTPTAYVSAVRRYRDEIGRLAWAAPQDWMAEPEMLRRTGLTMTEHQRRTVDSVLELRALAPELPWVPVLQGYSAADYLRCADLYAAAGIDVTVEPVVGIGSVCRRDRTLEASAIVATVASHGIRLHGFGLKATTAGRVGHLLTSADSMSWSFQARRQRIRLPGCTHATCTNCPRWALQWRAAVMDAAERSTHAAQMALPLDAAPGEADRTNTIQREALQ